MEPEVIYLFEDMTKFYDQFDEPLEDSRQYFFPEYVLDTYGDF